MNKWFIATTGIVAFGALLWWRAQPVVAPAAVMVTAPPAVDERPQLPVTKLSPPVAQDPTGTPGRSSEDEPLTLTDEASAKAMVYELFMRLEGPMRVWAESRGLARKDANGVMILDQPYQQYDDATLAALADNGDMWAQQILAERIKKSRPAEAIELYREAAANGSVFAMLQLAELAGTVGALSPDFKFEGEDAGGIQLDQYYSLRDSVTPPTTTAYAWKAVAEMAGIPGFMGFTATRLDEAEIASACDLAGSIYSDLLARRAAAGLGPYPSDPPPAWFDPTSFQQTSGCEHPEAVNFDFSPCREIRYSEPGEEQVAVFYVCDES